MFRALFYALHAAKAPKALPQAFITPVQSLFLIPPFGFAGGSSSKKRNREEAAVAETLTKEGEVVVLLNSDNEEEEQRKRIMKFAASRCVENNQQKTIPSTSKKDQHHGDGAAAADEATPNAAAEEDAARNRIMAHATTVNTERGITNNSLLAQLHAERLARRGPIINNEDQQQQQQRPFPTATEAAVQPIQKGHEQARATDPTSPPTLNILSYNLWFNEQVEIYARMQAISDIISTAVPNALPDVVCFQEVTPFIYSILSSTPWWRHYTAKPTSREIGNASYFTVLLWKINLENSTSGGGGSSSSGSLNGGKYACLPFENSRMGRDLKAVTLNPYSLPICIATSHLESPTGRQQLFSEPRQAQCQEALSVLDSMGKDAIYIGDMNWNEKNDGDPPLPAGWVDAWPQLHPKDIGYTYDTETNGMIKRGPWKLQLRLDRAFFKSINWKLESIEMLGKEALPGRRYEGKVVLPSDHYGLLVKLVAKPGKTLKS